MNLILRGHIRNAFGNRHLYDLIKSVSEVAELKIFVHTWNVMQTSLSWRRIREDRSEVKESTVLDYFSDLSPLFKRIIIEDERDVPIKGRTEGFVGHTPCPIRAYKYMFHGMCRAAECAYLGSAPEETTIQTRFDVLSNWRRFSNQQIIDFIARKPSKRIQFMMEEAYDESTVGVDNIYMATAKDMLDFIVRMRDNLDEIDECNKSMRHMGHQEWVTMAEAIEFNKVSATGQPG